jgi:thiol-disulfide isomerase/thioredoxin
MSYKTNQQLYESDKPSSSNTPNVYHITSLDDRNRLIESTTMLVVYNFAVWCGPCKTIAENYNKLAQELQKSCLLVKEDVGLNLGNHPQRVMGVPCFHIYKNGSFVPSMTVTGANLDELKANVLKLLNLN